MAGRSRWRARGGRGARDERSSCGAAGTERSDADHWQRPLPQRRLAGQCALGHREHRMHAQWRHAGALVRECRHDRGELGGIRRRGRRASGEGVNGAYLYDPATRAGQRRRCGSHLRQVVELGFESMMVAAITGWHVEQLGHAAHERDLLQPGQLLELHAGATTPRRYRTRRIQPTCGSSPRVTDGNTVNATAPTANTCWNTYIGRYTFAGPVISSLSPAAGPASGGEVVTVNGSDFATRASRSRSTARRSRSDDLDP